MDFKQLNAKCRMQIEKCKITLEKIIVSLVKLSFLKKGLF
nr:hypothetical protein GZ17A3_43 [uncultured archaeon GZfos17A3]